MVELMILSIICGIPYKTVEISPVVHLWLFKKFLNPDNHQIVAPLAIFEHLLTISSKSINNFISDAFTNQTNAKKT